MAGPYVIRGTHRAYAGADSKQSAWVRDDSGKYDMTGLELTVEVSAYSREGGSRYDYGIGYAYRPFVIPATSPELGLVEFTVPASGIYSQGYGDTRPSLYKFFVKADGVVIASGLLEIV